MANEKAAQGANKTATKTRRERKPKTATAKDILLGNVKKLSDAQAEYLNEEIASKYTTGGEGFIGKLESAIAAAFAPVEPAK